MKELVEKFLQGSASAEEAKKVLDWFQTAEGQKYLDNRFSKDVEHVEELVRDTPASPDAQQTLRKIEEGMRKTGSPLRQINRLHRHPARMAVAACIVFLIAVISLMDYYRPEEPAQMEPVPVMVYATGLDDQKLITLTDGTKIRLNENSSIEMPEVFNTTDRVVRLKGQAFFEVAPEESRPFIVQIGEAEVRVLGTEFNVKESTRSNEVYVAVSEGKVFLSPFRSKTQGEVLEKNTIGFFNKETREITKEDADVHNYLSWIHGRVIFDRTPFSRVITQLERIYEFESKIEEEELLDLRLTADFSEQSPQNVLDVIAHSLDIEFEIRENIVTWRKKDQLSLNII